MKSNREEIIEKLIQLDKDVALMDTTEDIYSCVIVGGSALVLMNKIYRSTHDIDSIDASEAIRPLLSLYNINMNVKAFLLNFPEGYLKRVQPVDIPTKKVKFYTASLEDLVVSKLCSTRDKDVEDIENELVYGSLDWELLDGLVEDVCNDMLNDYNTYVLRKQYADYKERFR